jgi:hypothetical protein
VDSFRFLRLLMVSFHSVLEAERYRPRRVPSWMCRDCVNAWQSGISRLFYTGLADLSESFAGALAVQKPATSDTLRGRTHVPYTRCGKGRCPERTLGAVPVAIGSVLALHWRLLCLLIRKLLKQLANAVGQGASNRIGPCKFTAMMS